MKNSLKDSIGTKYIYTHTHIYMSMNTFEL